MLFISKGVLPKKKKETIFFSIFCKN